MKINRSALSLDFEAWKRLRSPYLQLSYILGGSRWNVSPDYSASNYLLTHLVKTKLPVNSTNAIITPILTLKLNPDVLFLWRSCPCIVSHSHTTSAWHPFVNFTFIVRKTLWALWISFLKIKRALCASRYLESLTFDSYILHCKH